MFSFFFSGSAVGKGYGVFLLFGDTPVLKRDSPPFLHASSTVQSMRQRLVSLEKITWEE